MSNVNDLQSVADRLLRNSILIAPTVSLIEADKEIMREATTKADGGLTYTSSLGLVKTKKGSVAKLNGTRPVISADVWLTIPPKEKQRLMSIGLVSIEQTWSQDRKPSVEVKPSDAAMQAAA